VNLVRKDSLERFRETVTREYLGKTGQEPLVLPVESSDCAAEILGRKLHE